MNIVSFKKQALALETQLYLNRITGNGGSIKPSSLTAINTFVIGCKNDGIWDSLRDVGPLCGNDINAAIVKLKSMSSVPTYDNQGFTNSDYSEATGLLGNGSSYLKTRVLGTDLTSGSTGIGLYDRDVPNGANQIQGAADSSTSRLVFYNGWIDNHIYSDQYNGANEIDNGSALTGALGFLFATRTTAPLHSLFRNGSSLVSTATVGGTLPTRELYFMAFNSVGSAATFSTHHIAFLCLTDGMDGTQAASLNTRVQALQTALGRNV